MNSVDKLIGYLNQLAGLPADALVVVLCVVVGYLLRAWNYFPNRAIPMMISVLGAIFMLGLSPPPPDGHWRMWIFRNIAVGIILGVIAFISHRYAISRFESWLAGKVPGLNDSTLFTKDSSLTGTNPTPTVVPETVEIKVRDQIKEPVTKP